MRQQVPTASMDSPSRRRVSGLDWALRVTATLTTASLLLQAATAGGLLEGVADARSLHGQGALFVHGSAMLLLIAAVVLWRPRRGPGWPALVSLVLLVATFVQSMLGGSHNRLLHVPVGVALVIISTWLLVWAWSRRSAPAAVSSR